MEKTAAKITGRMGEEIAARALEKSGYTLLSRNVHTRYGEVDLIAEGEGCICFVEVKTRRRGSAVSPLESITPAKRKRIITSALLYLRSHDTGDLQPRFDLFSILTDGGEVVSCEHIKGVFDADGY